MSPAKVGGLLMERDGANEVIEPRRVCLDHPEHRGNVGVRDPELATARGERVRADARALNDSRLNGFHRLLGSSSCL